MVGCVSLGEGSAVGEQVHLFIVFLWACACVHLSVRTITSVCVCVRARGVRRVRRVCACVSMCVCT